MVKELEVGKWYKEFNSLIFITRLKNKIVFGYGFDSDKKFLDDDDMDWGYDTLTLATTEEITEALKNEAVKQGLTIENLPYIQCLEGFNKSEHQKFYKERKINYFYEKKENKIWIQNGSFLDICIFKNGIWAKIIKLETITIEQAEKKLSEFGVNVKIG